MKISVCVFLLMSIFSCSKKEKLENEYKYLVFNASGESFDYSMKINSDTIYVEKRFPRPQQNYYAKLEQTDRDTLNYILKKINLFKFNSLYVNDHMVDANGFAFFIKKDSAYKSVGIYGYNEPKELYDFAGWLNTLKKKVKLIPTNKSINFENLDYKMFSPPPPPPKK